MLVHIRLIFPWFVHGLDPPLGIRLRVGSVPDRRADGEPAKSYKRGCQEAFFTSGSVPGGFSPLASSPSA